MMSMGLLEFWPAAVSTSYFILRFASWQLSHTLPVDRQPVGTLLRLDHLPPRRTEPQSHV